LVHTTWYEGSGSPTMAVPAGTAAGRVSRTDSSERMMRMGQEETLLAINPMRSYGLERLIAEAREQAAALSPAGALEWLPDARNSFAGLAE